MAQPNTLIDVLQIEPGSGDLLTIDRDSADGSLRFIDAVLPSGKLLRELVGINNIEGLYLVGRAGDGATYTSIQDALNAVPTTSSAADPSVVLVMPGTYTENLVIEKDGVYLIGEGAVLTNGIADATVAVQTGPSSTPRTLVMRGLQITNTEDGEECIKIDGAVPASGSASVLTAPLTAGDVLMIGGTPLTGVAATRTSGSDDFDATLTTTTELATEIAAAINDPANSFYSTVRATSSGAAVVVTARVPGTGGNAITLIASTTPAGGITVSGPTLTGGTSGAGATLGNQKISIQHCDLLATGVGTMQISAELANNIEVVGGTWYGSSSSSFSRAVQVAEFKLTGVAWALDFDISYSDAVDQPSIVTSTYEFRNIGYMRHFTASMEGEGSLFVGGCPEAGDMTLGGDRTATFVHSRIGDLTLSDTIAVTLIRTNRGTATVGIGTPSLAESTLTGTVTFAASASEVVTFDVPQPDAVYTVLVDSPVSGVFPQALARSTDDFTLTEASGPFSGTVFYTVMRQLA